MYWALTAHSDIVSPHDAAAHGYGLRCPCCKQPVYRRAGRVRLAHFAHYSFGAKPECEFFYPFAGTTPPGKRSEPAGRRDNPPEFLPGAIILAVKPGGHFHLTYRLPQFAKFNESLSGTEKIRLATGIADKVLTLEQLRSRQYLPLSCGSPIVRASAPEALAEIREVIDLDGLSFSAHSNLFRMSEGYGALLAPRAPIELGERYFLITQGKPTSLPASAPFITLKKEIRGWNYYEVDLAAVEGAAVEVAALEAILGRAVRAERRFAHFVDPVPHHIGTDGACVFSNGTDRVLVRHNSAAHLSVLGLSAVKAAIREVETSWSEISGLMPGDFAACIDEDAWLWGRIEETPLFSPQGIVRQDTSKSLAEDSGIPVGLPVDLACPNSRVAAFVADRNGMPHSAVTASVVSVSNESYTSRGFIDCGNFGLIHLSSAEPANKIVPDTTPADVALCSWVRGLALASGGVTLASTLSDVLERKAPVSALHHAGWLLPYVSLIREE
jgi:hypothetical protein